MSFVKTINIIAFLIVTSKRLLTSYSLLTKIYDGIYPGNKAKCKSHTIEFDRLHKIMQYTQLLINKNSSASVG